MKAILNVIMVLLSMIALILEKSSCFKILVVGLLFMILFEFEKFRTNRSESAAQKSDLVNPSQN